MSRIVIRAGAAMSNPSRASANCWVDPRRGLTASTRSALLQDLPHLVAHLLDRLFGGDLLRHRLPEGGLNGIGRHVRVKRRDGPRLQVVERRLRGLGVRIL